MAEKHIIEGAIGQDMADILFIDEPTYVEGGQGREDYQYLGDLLRPHMDKAKVRVTVTIEAIKE